MSGLGIFVTKSYDKKPSTQGAKVNMPYKKTDKKSAKKMPAFLEKKMGKKPVVKKKTAPKKGK